MVVKLVIELVVEWHIELLLDFIILLFFHLYDMFFPRHKNINIDEKSLLNFFFDINEDHVSVCMTF